VESVVPSLDALGLPGLSEDIMAYDRKHFEYVLKEVQRHVQDTETSKLAHWHAAARYEKMHRFCIGVPATVLSIFLTWLLSSEFNRVVSDITVISVATKQISLVVSLLVSLLSGLGAFLNITDLAIKHRTAAENYHSLWRDCKNWQTDFPDESQVERSVQVVQQYRRRLNEINRESPKFQNGLGKV
jgi:hypothetical protein